MSLCVQCREWPLHVQISGVDVVRVLRRGSTAVHFTLEPLKEGAEVEIEVDWGRRFDHMQQHSGNDDLPPQLQHDVIIYIHYEIKHYIIPTQLST